MGVVSAPVTAQAVTELILHGDSSVPIAGFGAERFRSRQPTAMPGYKS